MIREMTLGQYYKVDSVLHKLDPRVKLLGTLLFVITLFFPKSLTPSPDGGFSGEAQKVCSQAESARRDGLACARPAPGVSA